MEAGAGFVQLELDQIRAVFGDIKEMYNFLTVDAKVTLRYRRSKHCSWVSCVLSKKPMSHDKMVEHLRGAHLISPTKMVEYGYPAEALFWNDWRVLQKCLQYLLRKYPEEAVMFFERVLKLEARVAFL